MTWDHLLHGLQRAVPHSLVVRGAALNERMPRHYCSGIDCGERASTRSTRDQSTF
jgi:hypothetical protein